MNRSRVPSAQRGFALVLALGAIAVVLLLAAALDSWTAARLEQARLIRVRVQDGLDAYSTRATVLYLLGTRRFTQAGLTTNEPREQQVDNDNAEINIEPVGGEIALDGTVYRGFGRVSFALYAASGQVALNGETQDRLEAVLKTFSSDSVEVTGLLDKLADYRDSNSMRRLNGAEQEEYAAAGLEPPANYHLRSVPELLRVLEWREWLGAHPGFRLHDWLQASPGRDERFNPNLVSAELLSRLLGITAEQAGAIVAERVRKAFKDTGDFNARAGVDLPLDDDEYITYFPGDSLQIRTWGEGAAQAEVLALQLTPSGRQGPWQIGSTYRITQDHQYQSHEVPGEFFRTRPPAAR